MPYSSPDGKREIHEWFGRQTDIKSVLDIGCGSGTYPKLLKDKNYRWIGIEIWEPYVKEFRLNEIYDCVMIGDFTNMALPICDCIIFGDVIEHLEKEKAIRAIRDANGAFKHIVISIPISYEQKAPGDNPFEEHKSVWTFEEIDREVPPSFKFRRLFKNIAVFIK